ncbi:hypothetical protein [Flavobacterium adhaerens]|uniref:hypothetical protein n=1 Tax=Flavobacterium adhaerens TaxID=3149043 RepID=UPI0032B3506B
MKLLKNISIGFIISFLGSLPLSYLNIVGVEILSELGFYELISYLFGIIIVQTVVVYVTVAFANQLIDNKKLMKAIDFLAIVFLLVLAYLFYAYSGQTFKERDYLKHYVQYSPIVIGMVLCALNFLQIPFWIGWNLYLMNAKYIFLKPKLKHFYVLGTALGTFFGILLAVETLESLSHQSFSFSKYIMPIGIPLFFIVLAIFQTFKVYKKHIR